MKPYLRLVTVLLLLMFGVMVNGSAMAKGGGGHGGGGRGGGHSGFSHGGGGHGGYHHGGGHGYRYGGVVVGIGLGSLYWPGYYGYSPYAYGYPAPAYVYPEAPVAYVEQGVPQAAPPLPPSPQVQPQAQGDWYFCPTANVYYPYVKECPGGWQRVPSVPP